MIASIVRGSKSSCVGGFRSRKLAVRQRARALVEAHLLALRERQPLDRSAFDLVLDDRQVDRPPDVVRRDVAQDPDLAGLAVDLDLDEVRAGRALDVDARLRLRRVARRRRRCGRAAA